MDQQFSAKLLRGDYKPFRPIRPKANDFTNDATARDLNWREVTLNVECSS
jgi:hypothetical protein